MKIVSIGDVHMATRNLARMATLLREADLMILSGDLTNWGGIGDARKVISAVREYCSRVLAVPGNLDQSEVFRFLEEENIALHGQGVIVDGVAIFGCGGSNLTPFHTPSELTEDEIYEVLQRGYEQVRDKRPLLMVCHTPPLATNCDRLINGKAVGSPAARRFIEEYRPDICISGHIHESAGTDHIGPTTILNAGPFKDGGYIVVTTTAGGLQAQQAFV